jgi:hypothetical protein
MPKKRIFVDLDVDILKTANDLQNRVLENDQFIFFKLHTSSTTAWFTFLIEMGMVKLKTDLNHWEKRIEHEHEISNNPPKEG